MSSNCFVIDLHALSVQLSCDLAIPIIGMSCIHLVNAMLESDFVC
jgi:hypothetical protein